MPEESEERSTEDVEAARGQSTPTEATEDADDEIFTAREVAILAYLMSAGDLLLLPLLAVVVSLLSDFGRSADQSYFGAVAQVAPVLLLTGIAEIAVSALRRERIEADRHFPPDVRRALNTIPVRTVLVYFLMAEATSLYALASDCSTTFLVVLCALATWAQVRAVVNLTLSRLKADPARGPLQLLGIPLQWVINVTIVNPFVALTGQLKAVGAKIALWVLERAQRILHRMFPDPDDDSAPPE